MRSLEGARWHPPRGLHCTPPSCNGVRMRSCPLLAESASTIPHEMYIMADPNPTTTAPHATAAPTEFAAYLDTYIGILRRGWRLIAISILVCLTLAVIYLAKTKRLYEATARLLVLQQGGRPID